MVLKHILARKASSQKFKKKKKNKIQDAPTSDPYISVQNCSYYTVHMNSSNELLSDKKILFHELLP